MFLTLFTPRRAICRFSSVAQSSDDEDQDLFDYFDPLLSPHAYPNGINPDERPREISITRERRPLQMDRLNVPPPTLHESVATDDAEFFDPTISPHEYTHGTPDKVVGDKLSIQSRRTGVLLIDHGSRRPDANQRLLELARLYQQSVADASKTIVTAAHMEIAAPSIRDGIECLLESGVDEIVCHPYFLSPGRHVQEDIPQLVKEAIESLNVTIPILTTDPVGSNTDLMIQAIDGMVKRASHSIERRK
ncbi:hypothetical protein MPSEU_000483000 [Mayamaea pseudoterrestris]|nr:hypothetical protein MPSEU_000483000 [Mayamaea pseudoterrestris]